MCNKFIKIISATLMFSFLSTSAVFAKDNSAQIKDNNLNNVTKIYSNKLSQNEKNLFIDSCKTGNKITMNELELYKKVDRKKNWNPKNENSLVKKYLDSVVTLGSKDSKELRDLGYSEQRAQNLKSAASLIKSNPNQLEKLAESQLLKNISSQLTIYTNLNEYLHDAPFDQNSGNFKTLINVLLRWEWSQAPIVQNTDGFGFGFDSANNLEVYSNNTGVSYYNSIDNSYYGSTDLSQQANNNISANKNGFFVNYPIITGKGFKKKIALGGYAFVTLVNRNSYIDQIDFTTLYGHSTDTIAPEFNLTNTGISISSQYAAVSNLYSKSQHYNISDYVPMP